MSFILNPAVIQADLAKGNYTAQDLAVIEAERERLYALLIKDKPTGDKNFYMTAGGPGSGKTTFIRHAQETSGALSKAVHADPDELIKLFQPYVDMSQRGGDTDEARKAAYAQWRWASVYLCNSIINDLASNGYDIIFGTTGTSPAVAHIYQAAHDAGYTSHTIICHAPESVRLQSANIRFRNERRFTPVEDIKQKGNVLFPQIVATHLACAHNVDILWRQRTENSPKLVASLKRGKCTVGDAGLLERFCQEIRQANPAFDWTTAVTAYAARFKTAQPARPPKGLGL